MQSSGTFRPRLRTTDKTPLCFHSKPFTSRTMRPSQEPLKNIYFDEFRLTGPGDFHSLDSEVICSQLGVIDLQHDTSILQSPLPDLGALTNT